MSTESDKNARPEEPASDSPHQGCVSQECYYQEDSHCPCYMCNNHGIDSKSTLSDDGFSGVEFAIRTFWRIAKTQNDIESPTQGNSKGFHYRLLLHPRGTAGTDSESSHLSVFVEAVVQDWYPEYWVFPNVRFELTVINFKDPKQSVTSWAHWSFSSDATSRGWQKMISHSRLTKAAGFMDDDGTVIIRGKAEPPYPCLWSKSPLYQPQLMWEYIPDRAQREMCSEICHPNVNHSDPLDSNSHSTHTIPAVNTVDSVDSVDYNVDNTLDNGVNDNRVDKMISDVMLLKCLDSVVPSLAPTLDTDYLALMVQVLYHLREFRRSVLIWNYEFDADVTEETSIILALQKVFAYMYLYPLAVSCRTYKLSAVDNPKISKYYMYELIPKSTYKYNAQCNTQCPSSYRVGDQVDRVVEDDSPSPTCCSFDGGRYEWEVRSPAQTAQSLGHSGSDKIRDGGNGYRLVPGSLSYSIGDKPEIFSKLLPPAPNLKPILKAMRMTDLQTMEPQDQLMNLHSELFTMILRDLASAKKVLKQGRLKTSSDPSDNRRNAVEQSSSHTNLNPVEQESTMALDDNSIPVYLRDQTVLESTCKFLFSGTPESESLFRAPPVDDISTMYIRCKHSNSLQKALEAAPKQLSRYPQVLFFYLHPAKNAKKGELFDVPLRLDCTCLRSSQGPDSQSEDSRNEDYGAFECSEEEEFGEFENGCERENTPVKWYSLYALVVKEGELRYDGLGRASGAFNSLLLRPEEDGPWYRMSEGRVEKLGTKMEFTEWKCHRDFFCLSAVYIAEDYIDMLQVGEVDLLGNLKQWNPNLYYSTLSELGVSELDLLTAIQHRFNTQHSTHTIPTVNTTDSVDSVEYSVDNTLDNGVKTTPECLDDYLHMRRIGQNHPKLASCCEVHGYNSSLLLSLDEKERRSKYEVGVTRRDVMRRANRLRTIAPFVSWLFEASKENTALLDRFNSANTVDNGMESDNKLLVNFLQKRERNFEEEFRHLISEVFFKEIAENMASNSIYSWGLGQCSCGCGCKTCLNRPAMMLAENGRFPGEELKLYLSEPATILFRNIQILRCHLEYFCKDCKNLTHYAQSKSLTRSHSVTESVTNPRDEIISHKLVKYEFDSHPTLQQILNPHKFELGQKGSEMSEFKSTSERSALFLIECVWDACVRYTIDCRTILFLKACSNENLNKAASMVSAGVKNIHNMLHNNTVHGNTVQSKDLEGDEMSYFDVKYDLSPQQELEIMRHFAAKYNLPSVSEMRNYLRRSHVLVYSLIRPHELLRSYLGLKYKVDVVKELEDLGYNIVWNEESFNRKASLSDLSPEELNLYGISNLVPSGADGIGQHLCSIYEKLLIKMLVHMQDVDKQVYPNCFDYVYTVKDIANIIEAIKLECDQTMSVTSSSAVDPVDVKGNDLFRCGNSCGSISNNMHFCSHEGCVCLGHQCRYNFGYTGFILPFWIGNEMADLSIFTSSNQPYNESLIEDLSELCCKTDDKKKKKVKPRKQSIEKATCIIPPLDVKLKQISFDQLLAHESDPALFLNPNSVARFYYKRDNLLEKHKFSQIFPNTNPYQHSLNMSLSYLSILNFRPQSPQLVTRYNLDSEVESLRVKNSIEIGILTTHDLFGLEGFSCEAKVVPTKRLFINSRVNGSATKVSQLYWALRRIITSQLSDDLLSLGSNRGKKGKCICDQGCPDENECAVKLSWRPCAGDCFMLYALKNDIHSLRVGKKFVYMQPGMDLSWYMSTDKARGPDITVLICGAPSSFYLNGSVSWFPLPDDSEYPLLIFKWMCVESVDLLCLGAVVCDAKKQLQQYIFEWLLPIIRDLGYLPSESQSREFEHGKDEDVDRYQVLEECSVRSVQNVRRWSCAIKKINKRSGDVIIIQLKRSVDSPATMRFKESVLFMNLVKELSEMEALELLPDPNNYPNSWSSPEQNQPDVNKLSKKKKRKSTKSAIPSNKKSTFTKIVQNLQPAELAQANDTTQSTNTTQPNELVDLDEPTQPGGITQLDNMQPKDVAELDNRQSDQHRLDVDGEQDKLNDMVDELVDEVGEELDELGEPKYSDKVDEVMPVTESESLAQSSDIKHSTEHRISGEDVDEASEFKASDSTELEKVAEVTKPDNLDDDIDVLVKEGEFRRILDLCPSIGLVTLCNQVYSLFELEFRKQFLQMGKKTKNLLKLVKMMYTRVSGPEPVREMVKRMHNNFSLKATFVLSHMLQDYNSTIPLMDDVLNYVLQDIVKFSQFLFNDKDKYHTRLLEQIAKSLYNNHKVKDKLDSSILFLLHVHLNTNSSQLAYSRIDADLKLDKVGYEYNGEMQDLDDGLMDKKLNLKSIKEIVLYNSKDDKFSSKPMLQWLEDEIEQFERIFLQQLKQWWNTRQLIMDKIKSNIHFSNNKDSINFTINNTHSTTKPGNKDELVLDLYEFRILLLFAETYPEITLCFNRDSITMYFNGKIDKKSFLKSLRESRVFFGTKNTIRSIPNLPIEHTDTTPITSSLMDMQLANNQTALILLSIKYSNLSQEIDSQLLKSICSYKTFKSFNIPPPPNHSASLLQDTI